MIGKPHNTNCECKRCKKNAKGDSKDFRFMRNTILLLFIFLIVVF